MTSNVELLPLPGSVADWLRRFGAANGSIQSEVIEGWFQHYARANVAHATAARDAEIEALRERVSRLDEVNLELGRQLVEHEDRAERLAEALREATAMLLADYPETAKRLRAALHPTAAQENDDA